MAVRAAVARASVALVDALVVDACRVLTSTCGAMGRSWNVALAESACGVVPSMS